ncbi:MAG: helix-turn-helix domain-containing protein [Pseudomonadota bacterium]
MNGNRHAQVVRQWRLVRMLINSPAGLAVPDIVKSFNVTIRTLYRDMEALEAAGFPLKWTPRAGRHDAERWSIDVEAMTQRERAFFEGYDPDL